MSLLLPRLHCQPGKRPTQAYFTSIPGHHCLVGIVHEAQRRDPEQRAISGGEGYVPTDFGRKRDDTDKAHPRWTLSLAFKRMPRPVLH